MSVLAKILGRQNKAPVPVPTPEWPELDGQISDPQADAPGTGGVLHRGRRPEGHREPGLPRLHGHALRRAAGRHAGL